MARIFYCERDFYSTPQVILIVADDEAQAQKMLDDQCWKDNYGGIKPELKELALGEESGMVILEPPGDRKFR